jgi:hypothetical protein
LHLTLLFNDEWSRDLTDIVSSFLVPIPVTYFRPGGPTIYATGIDFLSNSLQFHASGYASVFTAVINYEGDKHVRFRLDIKLEEMNSNSCKFTVVKDQTYAFSFLLAQLHWYWCQRYSDRTGTPGIESKELVKWARNLHETSAEAWLHANLQNPYQLKTYTAVIRIYALSEENNIVRPVMNIESLM